MRCRPARQYWGMAYDEELAARVRAALSFTDGIIEKRMFGGCAFLLHGHMVAAASRSGGLMLRVDPASGAGLVDGETVRFFSMGGREMGGWLYLEPTAVEHEGILGSWLRRGLDYVRTLPPK